MGSAVSGTRSASVTSTDGIWWRGTVTRSMPLGVVERDTAPTLTLVVGCRLGGMNRSLRPFHGSGVGVTGAPDGGVGGAAVVGVVFTGDVVCASAASGAVMVQVHNNAA